MTALNKAVQRAQRQRETRARIERAQLVQAVEADVGNQLQDPRVRNPHPHPHPHPNLHWLQDARVRKALLASAVSQRERQLARGKSQLALATLRGFSPLPSTLKFPNPKPNWFPPRTSNALTSVSGRAVQAAQPHAFLATPPIPAGVTPSPTSPLSPHIVSAAGSLHQCAKTIKAATSFLGQSSRRVTQSGSGYAGAAPAKAGTP